MIELIKKEGVKMEKEWQAYLEESLVKPFYEEQTEAERKAAFEEVLEFGTAGIRSTFGLGPGRLNKFTVRKVALGLARYLKSEINEPTVVIHYDTRFLSEAFANEIALVLATNGVHAILSDGYKSTPELSFAVRYLKADAGVMITASHNPSHYNGIKVYGSDGGQLLPEPSEVLSSYINQIDNPLTIKVDDIHDLTSHHLIEVLDESVTKAYKEGIYELVGPIEDAGEKVVLTSLHGTSLPLGAVLLEDLGFTNYVIETEQSTPDGRFPTVKSANPEEEAAFDYSKRLAEQENASLMIATDPDADRFGFVERYEDNTTRYFTGNEIGLILMKLRYQELLEVADQSYMVKSIVTGALGEALAQNLDIEVVNVLTGFKYISEQLKERESSNAQLVLAYEESHGYLVKDLSRDKDAIQFIPLLVQYKQRLSQNGLTFKDVLDDIYQQVGYYQDKTLSPTFEGKAGRDHINHIMSYFRNEVNDTLLGLEIKTKEDYLNQKVVDISEGASRPLDLPKADVLRFTFDEGFIALRPSGTEPKIKVYFSLNVDDFDALITSFDKQYLNM